MNNGQYGAPQHELNVLSSLLRDGSAAYQLVDWNHDGGPQYWLRPDHFQTTWLSDAYEALLPDGLADIKQRLQTYPGADQAQVAADVLTARMMTLYQQRAAAGDANAQWAVNQAYYTHSEFWAGLHSTFRQMAQPTWPANPEHTRHDAYVTARAAQHPSTTENIPFELARSRGYDNDARSRELAVIGAVLNDPTRAWQFRYSPQSPDASSPYWLQPQDFGDPATAEIWDALVTGPDPAIALPAATDPSLAPQQRTAAMIRHITTRLTYNDHHRSTGDPAAKARLHADVNQAIGTWLAHASSPDFRPDPNAPDFRPNHDNAAQYAVTFILEPSIPAAIEDLAGRVRDYGLSDASLGQIGLELSTTEYALNQLAERLDNAPRTLTDYSTPDQATKTAPKQSERQPSYTSLPTERRVLISLMQDPRQLQQDSPTRSLAEQDFTQPEHRYLFKAIQSLQPDAAQDRWLLNHQAQQLARHDGAPPLDFQKLDDIGLEARTVKAAPADQGAGHLVTMTVRRTARDASSAVEAVARETIDPRVLIDRSRTQFQHATREALRYHEQSVPEPTPYNTQRANVA
ncbi:DnaB-like helicase N-terminal domain-containing protein [Streptomyces sp. NPDC015350]|uniref:DnaB-like helicase N-terminal domain-containing protein n=1 Tax=Streptomyces sp. NPDC015350 TaxID=3364955 RepID=UPI0036FDFE25